MSDAKFLQVHTLTTYPGTLLNRDDAGFAKRLPFGGATRTRVSSQCLKYHWRNFDGENALYGLDVPRSMRSRETFRRLIAAPLVKAGYPSRLVVPAIYTIKERVLSDNTAKKGKLKELINPEGDANSSSVLDSNQITVLGRPEVRYIKELAAKTVDGLKDDLGVLWDDAHAELTDEQIDLALEAFKAITKGDLKKNLKGINLAAGLDAAMFGRMATSDVLARGDAAIHVAHAFTTHAENSESDYFSAVDELTSLDGELGSGHINSSELTSGLFYGYVVVDVPLLVSNLTGNPRGEWQDADRELAAEVVDRMVHLVATVSPGAKLGSTAPYASAQTVFIESGNSQPRTLANAFQRPVEEKPDVLANTYRQMASHLAQYDQMYGVQTERKLAGIGEIAPLVDATGVGETVSVDDAASWAAQQVRG